MKFDCKKKNIKLRTKQTKQTGFHIYSQRHVNVEPVKDGGRIFFGIKHAKVLVSVLIIRTISTEHTYSHPLLSSKHLFCLLVLR